MIHLIYIYFIVNAFLAGSGSTWKECLRDFLIGIPYHIVDIAWSWIRPLIWRLNSKFYFISFYKLWFTDSYKQTHVRYMDYARKRLKSSNWFERQFIKQLDKKYNYGITRKEAQNDNR